MGKEQVVRPKTCKIYYDDYGFHDGGDDDNDGDDDNICHLNVCKPEWLQIQSCLNLPVKKRQL